MTDNSTPPKKSIRIATTDPALAEAVFANFDTRFELFQTDTVRLYTYVDLSVDYLLTRTLVAIPSQIVFSRPKATPFEVLAYMNVVTPPDAPARADWHGDNAIP